MRVAHNQNHAWPQRCYVPVVVFQSRDGRIVRIRNRIQSFAGFDLVMQDCICRGGLGCGFVVRSIRMRASRTLAGYLRFTHSRSHRQVEIQNFPSGEAAAFQMVPVAQHLRRNSEIFGHRLDRISLTNLVVRSGMRVSAGISLLAGSNRDNQPGFWRDHFVR